MLFFNISYEVVSYICSFFCSVAVQNDFVRLSQSLQVELEKIRQAEKEASFIFSLSLSLIGVLWRLSGAILSEPPRNGLLRILLSEGSNFLEHTQQILIFSLN